MKISNKILAGVCLSATLYACTYSTDDHIETIDTAAEAQSLRVAPAPEHPPASKWDFTFSQSEAFPHETIVLGEYCSGNKFENNPATSLTAYLTAFDQDQALSRNPQGDFIEIRGLQAFSNTRCVLLSAFSSRCVTAVRMEVAVQPYQAGKAVENARQVLNARIEEVSRSGGLCNSLPAAIRHVNDRVSSEIVTQISNSLAAYDSNAGH